MDFARHLASLGGQLLQLAVWFALLLIVFAPLERMFGRRKQKIFRRFFCADLLYYFLNGIVPRLLMILPLTVFSAGLHRLTPVAFYSWMAALPLWFRLALALVANEIGGYWGHRWSHEIPFLWRFHAIHHSAEELDWLVTAKAHPVDIFFTHFCAAVPLYIFGLAQPFATRIDPVPVTVAILSTYWAYFVHANVSWRFGALERLVATPAFHHWHHTNDGPEVLNKNFSAMFPWVDQCFGTLHLPKAWPGKYGSDAAVAPDLAGQLLDPLAPAASHIESPALNNAAIR